MRIQSLDRYSYRFDEILDVALPVRHVSRLTEVSSDRFADRSYVGQVSVRRFVGIVYRAE